MQFLELVLQNFGPYIGRQEIDLRPTETDGVEAPIILFGGMNGGGKTTLMDAIRLALYGQRAQCSTRGNLSYGDFLSQCVNRHTHPKDLTQIELFFEQVVDGEPKRYRIVRAWTRDPKEGKDSLGIYEPDNLGNSDWKDEALSETWDEYMENLLPLGISNLFLFDGEQVKELAEQEAPPPIVVGAIQSLLGLELAERLAVDLEILINRKRKQLAGKAERAALEEIEQRLDRCQQEYDAAKQRLGQLKEKRDIAREIERAATATFKAEGGKIAREQSELKAQYDAQNYEVERYRDRLRELAAGSLPLTLVRPLLAAAQQQGIVEKREQTARLLQGAIADRDTRLLGFLEEIQLPKTKLQKVRQFLADDAPEANEDIEIWLDLDDRQLERLGGLLSDRLDDSLRQTQTVRASLDEALERLERTEQQQAVAAPKEEGDRLFKAMTEAQRELQRLEAAVENAQRDIAQREDILQKTHKELASYGEENVDRQNANHIIDNAKDVQATLKLFRQRLTLRKLNKLEIEVTECFRYLLHKSDLVQRVAIEAEDFRLLLYDRQGQPVPKHRLSAGEKQLLAIAFLWGLARVSGRQLPVAIDTPLGRLDSSHRQNLVERYFPAASHQVILLSTDTEIRQAEAEQLRECGAIAREYLLKYDSKRQQTQIQPGYFQFG
jgi:DNA sulfur modification protein DndD